MLIAAWVLLVGLAVIFNISLAVITCINGAAILLLAFIIFIKEKLASKDYIITKGIIVRYIEYTESIQKEYLKDYYSKINTTTYTAEVKFINSQGEIDYAVYKISTEDKPFQIGEEIEIVYNINDSSYFLLKKDKEKNIGEIILVLLGAVTLLIGILII